MPVPDFIVELRSMIGHRLLWLPGVTALVTDAEGQVLMGQRVDNGRWALPSGIPEPGEEMAAACIREVLEETGIEVAVDGLISVHTTPEIVYPNGDQTVYVDHFFMCRPIGGTAHVADDESLAVGWFSPDALPEPATPRTEELIKRGAEFALSGRTWFPG